MVLHTNIKALGFVVSVLYLNKPSIKYIIHEAGLFAQGHILIRTNFVNNHKVMPHTKYHRARCWVVSHKTFLFPLYNLFHTSDPLGGANFDPGDII